MEEEECEHADQRGVGERAEEVAEWFFRLNGFFLIPGFIVHPDYRQEFPRTEADLLGIRLKNSAEIFQSKNRQGSGSQNFKPMKDHSELLKAGKDGTVSKHLVVMVEVKAGLAALNGPWSDEKSGNMLRALRRVGFGNKEEIELASEAMYKKLRYVGRDFIVQYFSICQRKDEKLNEKYPELVQITFEEIAQFLCDRFSAFPQKIPENASCVMWKGFGQVFMRWFERSGWGGRGAPTPERCYKSILSYIKKGHIDDR